MTRAGYCVAGRGHSTAPPLRLRIATSFWARAKGLLLQRYSGHDEGLWLRPCRAIHTAGMRRAIDVVFLDRQHTVIRVVHNLRPYRAAWCWRAYSVVELPAHYCRRHRYYSAAIRRATRCVATVNDSCTSTAFGSGNSKLPKS
ncbi:DUF192 domain-containing protein [Pusillimonas sp.]|uniref:DUF192 domain-containing protein n=1 Tax=Pusillimonas sp. TaxID=3040095 RepID=UPI0037C82D24